MIEGVGLSVGTYCCTFHCSMAKHGHGQKNNGHTGSLCLDKPVLASNVQHKNTLHIENLPVPHTKHNYHKHGTRTQRVGKILHGPHVVTAHQQVARFPLGQASEQAWLHVVPPWFCDPHKQVCRTGGIKRFIFRPLLVGFMPTAVFARCIRVRPDSTISRGQEGIRVASP